MRIALFSDLHLGIKQDSSTWHQIAFNWADWFIEKLNERGIRDIIFLGDFFHNHNTISVNTLYQAKLLLKKFENFNLNFIMGNHDLCFKNNPEVSAVQLFDEFKNIKVYSKPEIVRFGEKSFLMCGWGYNPLEYEKADVLITHAEINTFKYNQTAQECSNGFKMNELLSKFKNIFSGHFHLAQNKTFKNGNIRYVGNPFAMDFSDVDSQKGFDIINTNDMTFETVINNISPKFIRKKLSEIKNEKEIKNLIENNFVKIIIDKNIESEKLEKVSTELNFYKPLNLTFEHQIDENIFKNTSSTFDEKTGQSMIDTIKTYIDNLPIENKDEVFEYINEIYKEFAS